MKNNKKQAFMTGVMTLIGSQIIVKLVGLIYKVYLTNKEGFGDTGNAIYNSGYQIYELLLLLSSIGIPNAISKLVSEKVSVGDYKGADRIFKVALGILTLIGSIGGLILFFGADFIATEMLNISESAITLKILSPAIVLVAISSVIRGYFNGRNQMTATANSQALEQILKTLGTVIIVEIVAHITSNDVVSMAAGATLATSLSIVGSTIYIVKYYKSKKITKKEISETKVHKPESTWNIIKRILTISVPAALTSIVTSINVNVDAVTVVRGLKKITSEENAKSLYGILTGKVNMITALPLAFTIAFATALVPGVSTAKAAGDYETVHKRIKISVLLTTLIGLPCAIGLFIYAEPIINLIYPNAPTGGSILRSAALVIIFTTICQTLTGSLQGLGNYKISVIALISGVVVKTILNLTIIPIEGIGIYGATFSSIVCHAICFIIEFTALKKITKIKFDLKKHVIKPLVATFTMGGVSYILYILLGMILPASITTILTILLAIVIYAIMVVVLKILSEEEIKEIPMGEKIYNILVKVGVY